jgi:hypothetical protein
LAAVAGVQAESRQHSEPSPFFHCMLPWPLRQLSLVSLPLDGAAKTDVTRVAAANRTATLFNFFMDFLLVLANKWLDSIWTL